MHLCSRYIKFLKQVAVIFKRGQSEGKWLKYISYEPWIMMLRDMIFCILNL